MDILPKFNETYSQTLVRYAEINDETINKYEELLPKELISLWKTYGFFHIDNGLIWFVNPADYTDVLEEWTKVNEMLTLENTKYYVIGRTGLGSLLIWTEVGREGVDSYLSCLDVVTNEWEVHATEDLTFFFDVLLLDYTYKEDCLDEILFKECYESLGLLQVDECYGLVPLPALGGAKDVKLAEKVKLREYLSICSQVFV